MLTFERSCIGSNDFAGKGRNLYAVSNVPSIARPALKDDTQRTRRDGPRFAW